MDELLHRGLKVGKRRSGGRGDRKPVSGIIRFSGGRRRATRPLPAAKTEPPIEAVQEVTAQNQQSAQTRLTSEQLDTFAKLLQTKRAELMGDLKTMRDEALGSNRQEAAGNLSKMPVHMADIGSDHYEQEFTLGLLESEQQMLREIDHALLRISAGTYGVCEATQKPISLARLRAQPWARYCVEYARQMEQNGHHRRRVG